MVETEALQLSVDKTIKSESHDTAFIAKKKCSNKKVLYNVVIKVFHKNTFDLFKF